MSDSPASPRTRDRKEGGRPGLRERKKQEVRERISGIATLLFLERGFDAVSVAEVAEAAGVSKMTVFNYFPRKEDLFLDRLPQLVELITAAVRGRPAGEPPSAALRDLYLRLIDERHPLAGVRDPMASFWQVVLGSPTLRARAREALDEIESLIAGLFAEAGDPRAAMTAALMLAACRVCYADAARRMLAGEPAESFLAEHRARVARALDAAAEAAAR
jgi:AcrR family transcriptional regulator